jgi:hypothetical protein
MDVAAQRLPDPSHAAGGAPLAARPATRAGFLPFAVAIGFAALVYGPLTKNSFHQDDFLNLQSIANEPLLGYLLAPAGGHVLILRNSLFWASYRVFGTATAWWFGTVLLTHLVNVGLLCALLLRLTGGRRLACFGATLWGVAPAQEGTLGWYSAYGHAVVATFLLLVLLGVARRWRSEERLRPGETVRWCALLLSGATAFGVGVGVAAAFPLVIVLLFPGARAARGLRLGVFLLPVVVLAGYVAVHELYAMAFGAPTDVALMFLLGMLSYWTNVVHMLLHLFAAGMTALVASFAHLPGTYPDATGYAVAASFTAAFFLGLAASGARERRLLLALAVVTFAAYAVIAAGRGTFFAKNYLMRAYGAAEPRYHYVATIPLAAILCVLFDRLGSALALPARARTALLVVWLAAMTALWARTSWRIDPHQRDREATEQVVATIDRTIRAAPAGAPASLVNQRFPPAVFAGWAAVYTIFFPSDADGRVYFVEADPAVRAIGLPGSRLAAVMVPPH